MAVITQNYDIDMQATGGFPVVKMSQFDTGSRTIVFTVYDGRDLAHIDGMVARVDGTRSDGVEFSSSCTVGAGSKVSFTISQEMTKHAGKHAAELVIFDASGNPIGTQNFVIDVEAAPMVRDSAASADDRTLYDQYTDSVEQKFSSLSTSLTDTLTAKTNALTKTVQDIDALLGGSSTARTIINQDVKVNGSYLVHVALGYDPISGMVALNVGSDGGLGGVSAGTYVDFKLVDIPTDYLPDEDKFTGNMYRVMFDGYQTWGTTKDWGVDYLINPGGSLFLRVLAAAGSSDYGVGCSGTWFARGGRYLGVNPIPTGSNTVTVGTTTTVDGGSEASVTNSGTAKDVVLDFEIPTQSFKGAGEDSVSISPDGDAQATERRSIAIGKGAAAAQDSAISIGYGSNAKASGNGGAQVVIGNRAVGGRSTVCIGNGAGTTLGGSSDEVPEGSVCVGEAAYAPYRWSVAVGERAKAVGRTDKKRQQLVGSDAYGSHTKATGEASVALGCYSYATESNVVSVGQGDSGVKADGERVRTRRIVNVSDPVNAQDAATKAYVDSHAASGGYTLPAATASTLGGVKVGDNLTVAEDGTLSTDPTAAFAGTGEGSIAISADGEAKSSGTGSIAIGKNAHTSADHSVTIGSNAAVGAGGSVGGSVVIGGNAGLRAQGSGGAGVIVGANARGDRSAISIGESAGNNGTSPTQVHGISIGSSAWAFSDGSVALGSGARATASDQYRGCTALGGNAIASAIGSVALGEQSKATDSYTVSVGEGSGDLPSHVATRRIVNVTDPRDAQDAATKAYVDALEAKLTALEARVAALEAK